MVRNPAPSSKESAGNLLRAAEIIRSSAGRAFFASANSEIADAMRLYYTDTHNVTEGAGAAPLAGLIRERQRCSGKRGAVTCSGSNIDAPVFAEILAGRTPAA
jgi:threonine dehydratase